MEDDNNDFFNNLLTVPEDNSKRDVVVATKEEAIEQDFVIARDNLMEVAEIAQKSLRDMATLAGQMQHPKGYDVLAKSISSAVIVNKALLEIHKNRIEGKDSKQEEKDITQGQVTNNVLVMTTAQMAEWMSEARDQLTLRDGDIDQS